MNPVAMALWTNPIVQGAFWIGAFVIGGVLGMALKGVFDDAKSKIQYRRNAYRYYQDKSTLELYEGLLSSRRSSDSMFLEEYEEERKLRRLPESLSDPQWEELINKEYQDALSKGTPAVYDFKTAIEHHCAMTGEWAMTFGLHWPLPPEDLPPEERQKFSELRWQEMEKAAPWLRLREDVPQAHLQATVDSEGVMFFRNREDAMRIFELTKGDDPCKYNPYNKEGGTNNRATVYALVIGPSGAVTENT